MFFISTMVAAPFSDSGTYLHGFPMTQGLNIYTSDYSELQFSEALVFFMPNYHTFVSDFSCQLFKIPFFCLPLPVTVSAVNSCCHHGDLSGPSSTILTYWV